MLRQTGATRHERTPERSEDVRASTSWPAVMNEVNGEVAEWAAVRGITRTSLQRVRENKVSDKTSW